MSKALYPLSPRKEDKTTPRSNCQSKVLPESPAQGVRVPRVFRMKQETHTSLHKFLRFIIVPGGPAPLDAIDVSSTAPGGESHHFRTYNTLWLAPLSTNPPDNGSSPDRPWASPHYLTLKWATLPATMPTSDPLLFISVMTELVSEPDPGASGILRPPLSVLHPTGCSTHPKPWSSTRSQQDQSVLSLPPPYGHSLLPLMVGCSAPGP